ncbi:hypothetical protein QTG56_01535 [Rossellomorea sp. AcN35-11]|nr:hypothetical protein QTG56_01535 [Rossellomorea sp. AcN35-11]
MNKLKNTFSITEEIYFKYLSGLSLTVIGQTKLGLEKLLDYTNNAHANIPYFEGESYYQISLCYSILNKPESAIFYAKKASIYLQDDCNYIRLLHSQSILAINYTRMELYLEAEKVYSLLIRNSRLLSLWSIHFQAKYNLSLLKIENKQFHEAEELMKTTLDYYSTGSKEYINILLNLIELKIELKIDTNDEIKTLISEAYQYNLNQKQKLYLDSYDKRLFSQLEYLEFLEKTLYPYIIENGTKKELHDILSTLTHHYQDHENTEKYVQFSKALLNIKE